jgi:hypothetical protein
MLTSIINKSYYLSYQSLLLFLLSITAATSIIDHRYDSPYPRQYTGMGGEGGQGQT